MNYGEVIAYWYFRLNGFFPLPNFVLHHEDLRAAGNRGGSSADTDILAVRFPHVYEEVGGLASDWDPFLLDNLGILQRTTVVIVEVKTGTQSPGTLRRELEQSVFALPRLQTAVLRVGVVPRDQACPLAEALRRQATVAWEGLVVSKMTITERKLDGPWLSLTLRHVDRFIQDRIARYKDPKRSDRLFFPDPLIQYLAWRGGM